MENMSGRTAKILTWADFKMRILLHFSISPPRPSSSSVALLPKGVLMGIFHKILGDIFK